MPEQLSENPKTVADLFREVDALIPPGDQAKVFWPSDFDRSKISDSSLDKVGDSDHELREFFGAELFMAADRMRRRVELGKLDKIWRGVADNLDALVEEKLGVTRGSVSDMIHETVDEVLMTAPS